MSDDVALDLERKRLRKQAAGKQPAKNLFTDPLGIGEAPNSRRSGQVYPDLSDPTGAAKKAIPMPKTSARKIPDLSKSSMGSNAPVPSKSPKWKQYKSIAAAKKAGENYYSKNGKKMAALYKEDLDKSLSKRDAYNKALGLKRADGSAVEKAKPKKDTKGKADTKKKSFRERRAARMEERLASDSIGEGRKKRIKRRLSRVKRRMGEPKGYAKGGKVRGAGIAQRGVRPCKMR